MADRGECLSEDDLRAVAEDRGSDEDRLHLERCAGCRDRALALGDTLDEPLPQSEPAGGDDLVGRFRKEREIGRGSMGVVFAAYDPDLDRRVALKFLGPARTLDHRDAQARLLAEGRALAKLNHPNVVVIHDVGTHQGEVFIATEYIDGGTLQDFLATERSEREIVEHFIAAARGLAAAHELGLVHRDFKPSNVLIGRDGRPRVTDFGLVHQGPSTSPGATPIDLTKTSTGALVGTPAYMAPEQFEGGVVGPYTDQFAFGIALYEALSGHRPFTGDTFEELSDAVRSARRQTGPTQASPGVAAVIRRALSHAPSDRYPNMDSVIEALEQAIAPPARRRSRLGGTALAVGLTAAALGAGMLYRAAQDDRCASAGAAFDITWNPQRRRQLVEHFEAAGKPFLTALGTRAAQALDAYADDWETMSLAACQAIGKPDSKDQAALRSQCLSSRRVEFDAVVKVLSTADDEALVHALEMLDELPGVRGCANLAALSAPTPPPEEEETIAEIHAISATLARIAALDRAGRIKDADAEIESVERQAAATGYKPIEAAAKLLRGRVAAHLGRLEQADALLRDAAALASASRDELVAARSLALLVRVRGVAGDRHALALEAAQFAEAAVERLDGFDEQLTVRAELHLYRGLVRANTSDTDAAIEDLENALRWYRAQNEPFGERAAQQALGATFEQIERWDDARAAYRAALEISSAHLGPDHPSIASAQSGLGDLALQRDELEAAESWHRKALELRERSLGRDHPDTAISLANLASVRLTQGDTTQALALYRRALDIVETRLGPDHYNAANIAYGLGVTLRARGDHAAAARALHRAVTTTEKAFGPAHPSVAAILGELAQAELALGRRDVARAHFARALAIDRAHYGEDHPLVHEDAQRLRNLR